MQKSGNRNDTSNTFGKWYEYGPMDLHVAMLAVLSTLPSRLRRLHRPYHQLMSRLVWSEKLAREQAVVSPEDEMGCA